MNKAMQLYMLKTICCILIINVTFCSSCFKSICKARCYFKHNGFDFGYCENGICKCAPPVIYVFDGIGRDLSDEYIDISLKNNNVIQELKQTSRPSKLYTSDENKKYMIWRKIVEIIIEKYPFIKEENLKDLKAKIFNNLSDLNNFYLSLQNTLVIALNEMKEKIPNSSKESNDLLNLILQHQKKNGADNLKLKYVTIINEDPNLPLLQGTKLSATAQTENTLTKASPRNFKSNKCGVARKTPSANLNEQQNINLNSNQLQPKPNTKQTAYKMDKTKDQIFVELSSETVEYYDSYEQSDKEIKKDNSKKSQTSNNDKIDKKLPTVKKENIDNNQSYESQSGSESYESFEEETPAKANVALGTSNK
ncbi:uncharacterized protein LOC112597590 [Melanaphis sacchari]|uniref:uncharacterized protein LOC112597590 n=1 Tax=Melanaphis sacchari TaxID=742174 RepID=UPI000DC140A0|nr:uncharacterized protein LOC112597590 [Melanaphis sacchari]